MAEKIQFLHIEDNPLDAELIEAELRREWPDCGYLLICSKKELCAALAEKAFDVLLSDYSLPGYNGMTALAYVLQHAPKIPFIFVTGTMGEEMAIETLKSGASDYVLKSSLAKLVPAVERALRERKSDAERRQLEKQIARAACEWQSTFDAISDSIVLMDGEQRVIRCNLATAKLLGKELAEIINQPCWKAFHGTTSAISDCPMCKTRLTRQSESVTIQENDRWLEMKVDPIFSAEGDLTGCVHIVRDVTARKEAEESLRVAQAQLLQSEKLATIGLLAAGVAHEINNPMSFLASNMLILHDYIEKYHGYIERLEEEIRAGSSGVLPLPVQSLRQTIELDYVMRDITGLINENMKGIESVKRIVQDLKTFSRVDSASKGLVDLSHCLDSTINIIHNEIKYVAELKREYSEVPMISSHAQQLSQVFMNLLINAVHAIQAKGEGLGEIKVRTWCDDENAFVSVTDSGCGIAPEEMKKIFDPFFTTKEVGKGSGLGLSISAELIRKQGGELKVVSELRVGSTFTVQLPLIPLEKH